MLDLLIKFLGVVLLAKSGAFAQVQNSTIIDHDPRIQRHLTFCHSPGHSLDPYDLLRKQRAIYASAPPDIAAQSLPLFDKILKREFGVIAPASQLDLQLLSKKLAISNLEDEPSEFLALVFERPANRQVPAQQKILWLNSETAGAQLPKSIKRQMRKLIRSGYTFTAHIHNHPFHFQNPYGDIGGSMSPSPQDLETFRQMAQEFGLKEARITNGISTIRIQMP